MKQIKTSKLIEQENIARSITVTATINGYVIEYFLKEQTPKGKFKKKTIFVDKLIEDIKFESGSDTVTDFHTKQGFAFTNFKNGDFYINLYKKLNTASENTIERTQFYQNKIEQLQASNVELLRALKESRNDVLRRVNEGQLQRAYILDMVDKAISNATK